MILRDRQGRITLLLDRRVGVQIGGFHTSVRREKGAWQFVLGWDPAWRAKQKTTSRCKKCKRWVGSPCNDYENYYESGPWDYSCEMVLFPHRFQ